MPVSLRALVGLNVRITGAIYDSTNSDGSFGQVLHSSADGVFWDTPVTMTDAVAYAMALGLIINSIMADK